MTPKEKEAWHNQQIELRKEQERCKVLQEAAKNRQYLREQLGDGHTPPGYWNGW